MTKLIKEITREQYDRAMQNNGYIADADMTVIFNDAEIWGWGVYSPKVSTENGKYYVTYKLGNSCD